MAAHQKLHPRRSMYVAASDARQLPLSNSSIDLVVTSPPYWQKRDYGYPQQIGRERTVDGYIASLLAVLDELRRVLTPWGSVFLNIGDTYVDGSLAGVPSHLEIAARRAGWLVPNRIVWAKPSGMPSPHRTRLVARHEVIFHLTSSTDYFYDLDGYLESLGDRVDSGDVWTIPLRPNRTRHLAPFPPEIAERAIHLACPRRACSRCGRPELRRVEATAELNPERPQARRAMELARERGITDDHIRAIRATGICDAGKAQQWQTGAGKNTDRIQALAAEAKEKLGGYFREFTFPLRKTVGFRPSCRCKQGMRRGIVLDPFAGTGTSIHVAAENKRIGIGFDYEAQHLQLALSAGEAPSATGAVEVQVA